MIVIQAARSAILVGLLALAGSPAAWAFAPEAPGSYELEFDLGDVMPRGDPTIASTIWARVEWLYVFRGTGALIDRHDDAGDQISLSKDLGVTAGQFRPLLELGLATDIGGFPVTVRGSIFEWDATGTQVLDESYDYGPRTVASGDYAHTRVQFLRTTLEAGLGVFGYDQDPYAWKLDVVGGVWLLAAQWDVNLQNQADVEGQLGDPRVFVGVEAHRRVTDWLGIHLRGVIGNPSTVLGGWRAAADLYLGPLTVRAEALFGTPTFGEWALLADLALTDYVAIGFVWREWFDQFVDGGAFFGGTNEGFVRMHHSLVGLSLTLKF